MAEKEWVERKALLKLIRELYGCSVECDEYCPVTGCYEGRIIMAAPAADVVEVVHGEWIFDFELDGSKFYKCSVCGRQEVLLAKESTDEYFPYCHCGAKMDGERKEQNNV